MKTGILILSAGKGTRMKTDEPKALVKVLGKSFIQHLLDNIKNSNYNSDVYLLLSNENKEIIQNHLKGKDFNIKIFTQKQQLGTGHAVNTFIKENKDDLDQLLVLYVDHPFISERVINNLLEKKLLENQAIHLLTCSRLCEFKDIFMHWGRVLRDKNGKIVRIREYKDASNAERAVIEVNPGIMLFDYKWLKNHLDLLSNENKSGEYYLTDLIRISVDEGQEISSGGILPKEAIGINTLEELKLAEQIHLGQGVACPF